MQATTHKTKILGKRLAQGDALQDLIAEGHTELMFNYKKIKENQQAYMIDKLDKPKDLDHTTGIWIWGPRGVGKSHHVRHAYGYTEEEILKKNCNKWLNDWDLLKHKAILLDDLDKAHANLGHFLKIWGDKYAFQAEVKGSTIPAIRPEHIFVTSNYSPLEIWPED